MNTSIGGVDECNILEKKDVFNMHTHAPSFSRINTDKRLSPLPSLESKRGTSANREACLNVLVIKLMHEKINFRFF